MSAKFFELFVIGRYYIGDSQKNHDRFYYCGKPRARLVLILTCCVLKYMKFH